MIKPCHGTERELRLKTTPTIQNGDDLALGSHPVERMQIQYHDSMELAVYDVDT